MISKEHIAVVVPCQQPDKASLRVIDECATNFGTDRVFVLDYGSDDSFALHAALDENDFHAVNCVHMPTHNKIKALEQICTSDLLANYSHVLLVDNQAGARIELLQDGLGMQIDIPTCAYFAHYSAPTVESSKPNWLSSFLRKQNKPKSKQQQQRFLKPTFSDERNVNMPNHFLDLWNRSTLLMHLRDELNDDKMVMSSFCSLQKAILRSTPYQ